MSFWKNSVLDEFEHRTSGDPLRGLAKKEFPWALGTLNFQDAEGDSWQSEITCERVEQASNSKSAKAYFKIISNCQVADTNLEKMGLAAARIHIITSNAATQFSDTKAFFLEIDIAKVEEVAQKALEKIRKNLAIAYTFNTKQRIIWTKVRATPISKFSIPEQ